MRRDILISRADVEFYRLGKWIFIPIAVFLYWFGNWGFELLKGRYSCLFLRSTGFPCPGCGGTHALYYLSRGELLKSFIFHPAVIYCVAAYIHFMALFFIRKNIKKNIIEKPIHTSYYAYGLVSVILVQWVVKLGLILTYMS